MKFLVTFVLLFGYVFAEDFQCSDIRLKMNTFEYSYIFSGKKFEDRKYTCKVHPNIIEEKLYLLFICSTDSALISKIIFAAECDGEVKMISDINNFTINTFYKNSTDILLSSEFSYNIKVYNNSVYSPIPINESEIHKYYKEITYLLLSRRYSKTNPDNSLKFKFDLDYGKETIAKILKNTYQIISSPIIYCSIRNVRYDYEIKFFPPRDNYFFCNNKILGKEFIKLLITEYNAIILTDLSLYDKILKFKSSLEKLIEIYQKKYSGYHAIVPSKDDLIKKPHTENNISSVPLTLDSSLENLTHSSQSKIIPTHDTVPSKDDLIQKQHTEINITLEAPILDSSLEYIPNDPQSYQDLNEFNPDLDDLKPNFIAQNKLSETSRESSMDDYSNQKSLDRNMKRVVEDQTLELPSPIKRARVTQSTSESKSLSHKRLRQDEDDDNPNSKNKKSSWGSSNDDYSNQESLKDILTYKVTPGSTKIPTHEIRRKFNYKSIQWFNAWIVCE